MSKKALIAMSGGVDSSVAAYLMKEKGFDCIGATMKLYESASSDSGKSCCTEVDAADARSVAMKLGMPFYVFNYIEDFERDVIADFVHCYEIGETPNPCIRCNQYLKFHKLLLAMQKLGLDYIVTGHYARIEFDAESGRFLLRKAVDLSKDQSYVLYQLTQEQLSHILFPLGELKKSDTREIALKNHFINAKKSESQDICFIPDGDYAAFIERFTAKCYPRGNFVDQQGNVLGEHKGIIRYTVGQRKGLGLALPRSMYVCRKDADKNEVVLCYREELSCEEVFANRVNWIAIDTLTTPLKVKAKIRYNQEEQPAVVYPVDADTIRVVFDEALPLPAAKGQALVLYDGDVVVGGGTII